MRKTSLINEAGPLRAFLLLVAVTSGLIAVEALVLPELFASPGYDTLRPFLGVFGGASLAVVVGAAAVSRRRTRRGIAGGLLLGGLPASVLAIASLTTGSPVGAWAWSVLATASAGLGVALLTGRAPRWRPVAVVIGLVLAGNGVSMLVSPGSFSRTVYGELVDALLPFGVVLAAAGAGLVAGEALGRRGLTLAGAALAEIGLVGLVATFIGAGLWVGVVLRWMLALVLVVALLGEVTVRRMATAQLALLVGLGTWMLMSHLRGHPATNADALFGHAAIVALVGAWLLAEVRPNALWPARAFAAVVVVLTAADALGLWGTAGGVVAATVILPIHTGVVLVVLAAMLLARTWWPDVGAVHVANAAAITATGALALVHLLATTITAGASPLQPILHLEGDQAFLLFATATALGLLDWRRAAVSPIRPRVYAAVASALAIVSIGSVVAQRALEALARPGEVLEPAILALTDRVLVLLLALFVLALVGSVAVISGQIVRPIERLTVVARRRAAGDRTVRANLAQPGELGALGAALDAAFAAQDSAVARAEAAAMELAHARRLESIGQLAGGIAHDFNNLLAIILNYARFAAREAGDGAVGRDIGEVVSAAERAAVLTRQLLTFSRREVVRAEIIDLNPVVRDTEALLTRTLGEQIAVRVSLDLTGTPVCLDRGHLEQVLMNLALNARDAMPVGGTLTIETARVELDERESARHVGLRPGPHVRLRVSDTGAGMPPEVLARAFDPFFTTKARGVGTGLGLSIVHGIVTGAAGSVELNPRLADAGRGTVVEIHLPAAERAAAAPPVRPPEVPETRGSETVLVVEDDPGVRRVTERILVGAGYRTLLAASRADALAIANGDASIDLLLSDVVMPERSGPELAADLVALRPGLKVLFMSGYPEDQATRTGIVELGGALVVKPFTDETLLRSVRAVLDG